MQVLQMFPFMEQMSTGERNELEAQSIYKSIEKGTVIVEEGTTCSHIALVIKGSIRVYKLSEEGKEITLYRIMPGDTCVLMISCLMGGTDYPAIAVVEEQVDLMLIPATVFQKFFFNNKAWQTFVFQILSKRLMEVMLIVEEIAFKSMDQRLLAFLRINKVDNNEIKMTHEAIAFELGTAREVVSRLLKDFEKKEWVTLNRGKIKMLIE